MEYVTIFITLLLISGAIYTVVYPLWAENQPMQADSKRIIAQTDVQTRYQNALNNIKVLQLDYETGKIEAEQYQPLLQSLKVEAAQLQANLAQQPRPEISAEMDAQLEAMISQAATQPVDDELREAVQEEIEQLKATRPETELPLLAATNNCPKCGHPTQETDLFCVSCGYRLTTEGVSG